MSMLARLAVAAVVALPLSHMAPSAFASATRGGYEVAPKSAAHAGVGVATPARKGPCGDGLVGRSSYCIFAGFAGAGLAPESPWLARSHGPVRHLAVRPARDLVARFELTFRHFARAPPHRPARPTV